MARLHTEKPGIRGLVIAESYIPDSMISTLAGVVMRSDYIIDGFAIGQTTVSGDDATDSVTGMYSSLSRDDISYVMVWGTILSHYNRVDIRKIARLLQIPALGVSCQVRADVTHTPDTRTKHHRICLHTGHVLSVIISGCTISEATLLLNRITIQGGIPEPVRVARLLASAIRHG